MLKLPAFLKPKRQLNLLIAGVFLALQMPLFLAVPQTVSAAAEKVYVCKYVGTPGTDERLQTGQNPIEVSVNSIKNWNGQVPGYFSDAHDRSYVLDYVGEMNPEPTAADCPAPERDVVQIPAAPAISDPCNPQGVTNNVAWTNALPEDTATIDWSESNSGATRTATLIGNNVQWSDQTTAPKVFTLSADAGIACEVPVVVVSLPAVPSVTDPCGSENASWNIPEDTDTLRWDLVEGELVVTILPVNTTFPGGATSYNYGSATDSNEACPEEGKKVYVCKYVGTPGVDERLKEGKNPIEVSVNSIQNNQWNGQVPGYFSDAHDRSYVLGYVGEMNPEPTAANCPAPVEPEAPTASATIIPCVFGSGFNDIVSVNITNNTDETVEYTVQLGGQTKYITLEAGESDNVNFSGVPVGIVTASVTGDDETETTTNEVTVATCEDDGDILGEVIPTGGQGAAVVTPAPRVLANTGKNLTASMFAAIAIIGATCALAITSRRARFNQ